MTTAAPLPSKNSAITAVTDFIRRILPERVKEFRAELLPGDDQADTFEISGGGDKPITFRGNSPSAMTAGFNYYLKFYCNSHISWCGNHLDIPSPLPRIDNPVRISSPYRYRYYFNYCTFSYSMAWWDWQRWEKEIDWMALAGINIPLAITGQEAIWQRVYRNLGLDDKDLAEFFAGPAFLAWGWMGNLDGWGGPTTQAWIDDQRKLQSKILQRMRELGMKPVMPAFTGHVPPAVARKFPGSKIKQLHNWAETFTGTYMLDPLDPLFAQIAHAFIVEQKNVYGTDLYGSEHFYSCDSFNENTPPSNDPKYLASIAKSLYHGMADADPAAVWVMQGWMFFFNPDDPDFWQMPQIHALLDEAPKDRLIMLDLHSEGNPLWRKTDAYCGRSWVWCFLHNFGAHRSMYGHLARLAHDAPAALADAGRGKMDGFGITPEGIDQNPVMYDLATELMWRSDAPDPTAWLRKYVERRYGKASEKLQHAWDTLRQTVYSRPPEWSGTVTTVINLSPRINAERMTLNYAPQKLFPAWQGFVESADELRGVDPFIYDLVDVTRQVLSNYAATLHGTAVAAYFRKDTAGLDRESKKFLELVQDLDRLLGTRHELLLGSWLEAAKAGSPTDDERRLREWNARLQITLWGERNGMLRDYARKEWAGLYTDFYLHRWDAFFKELSRCMAAREHYAEKDFQRGMRGWEEEWTHKTNTFASAPVGDAVAIARELFEKYKPMMQVSYLPNKSLTTDKPVTASSGTKNGHPAEHAVTGVANRASFWSAEDAPQWIMVDLQTSKQVNAAQLFTFWDGTRIYTYTIETSQDGKDWSMAVDASKNETPATFEGSRHEFEARPARFLKLTVLGNSVNKAVHVLDFRAYGPGDGSH